MPIHFHFDDVRSGFFTSIWTDTILNDEMVEAYEEFLEDAEFDKVYREFADFSAADISLITHDGLRKLSAIISEYLIRNGITDARCASYIPGVVNHGLLQLYDYINKHSPEVTRIFTEREPALDWLQE